MADINSLSFGCGETLLAGQLNIMADAIRSLITLVGSYIPLSGSEDISGVLAPDTDEGHNLGKSDKRWGTVWASTGGFKTIDFYSLQNSGMLGTLEINSNNGRLQYAGKVLATLEDIVNINPGESVITTDGDSVNLSDYTVSCNNIICDNTIRAKQKGSFQKIIIGDDPDYSELNEEEHPIYATLEYNIFSRDPDDSNFEDNNLTISTVLLLGRGLYKGAPIHIDTNYEGLYVDGNLIIPLPPIEEDEDYNTYLHVDENGSLEWVSASPGVGVTSLSGLSDVNSYTSSDQGKCLRVNSNGNGTEWSDISLSDLSNTEIGGSNNALSNGLVLVYDSSLNRWKNASLPANLPNTSTDNNGQYLTVENGIAKWVPVTPGGVSSLNDLSDVSIGTGNDAPTNGQLLVHNGTNWVNKKTLNELTIGNTTLNGTYIEIMESDKLHKTIIGTDSDKNITFLTMSRSSTSPGNSGSTWMPDTGQNAKVIKINGVTVGSGGSGLTSGSWASYFDGKTKGGITPTSGYYLKWDSDGNLTQDSGSYTLPAATDSALGGIKIGYTNNNKNYKVLVDNNGNAYVNVPWTDSGARTYTSVSGGPTADKNLSFGGSFTVPLVSLDTNGQISILNKTMTLPSGGTGNGDITGVTVDGLGLLARKMTDDTTDANYTYNHHVTVPSGNVQVKIDNSEILNRNSLLSLVSTLLEALSNILTSDYGLFTSTGYNSTLNKFVFSLPKKIPQGTTLTNGYYYYDNYLSYGNIIFCVESSKIYVCVTNSYNNAAIYASNGVDLGAIISNPATVASDISLILYQDHNTNATYQSTRIIPNGTQIIGFIKD